MGSTVVIGCTFVDLKGFPFNKYDPQGRNPGEVKIVHGGVGRNVVENFANVGMPVSYVGMLEDSAFGRDVERHLREIGANLDYALTVPENGIGTWLVIFDERGELAGSISKVPDFSPMESFLVQKGDEIVSSAGAVVLEMDLNESIAETVVDLAEKYGKRVYAIVGNMSVVLARRDLIRRTDCFICNVIEAAKFFGEAAAADFTARRMLEFLPGAAKEAGIASMVVTMAEQGSVYYDGPAGTSGICPICPTEVVDTSGAGDAFFSGTVMGLIRGEPLSEAVRYGARLASATISREEACCPADKEFFDR